MTHPLVCLQQVLQRKTEEAAMATKKLKELLEARKSSSRENPGTFSILTYPEFTFHSAPNL